MDGNEVLTPKQLRVIPFLLESPSIEEGCKKARVAKATFYGWLKEEAFKEALRSQREEVIRGGLETLKANVSRATETLVRLLDSEKEAIQVRAAEDIIEFTQKALDFERIEKRVGDLERRLAQNEGR